MDKGPGSKICTALETMDRPGNRFGASVPGPLDDPGQVIPRRLARAAKDRTKLLLGRPSPPVECDPGDVRQPGRCQAVDRDLVDPMEIQRLRGPERHGLIRRIVDRGSSPG